MKNIDLAKFHTCRSTALGNGRFLFPKGSASSIIVDFPTGTFCDEKITTAQYLSMDVTAESTRSAGLCWQFWTTDSDSDYPELNIKMGILPNFTTRLALPFSELSAKTLFLPRTPGKLKTVVHGHPIHMEKLRRFAICVDKTPDDLILRIENVRILESEPDYPLADVRMVDELGQKTGVTWPGKTESREKLVDYLRTAAADTDETPLPGRSRYGGWTSKRFGEGSGFFGLEHDGKRYWLRDPDGYAFFSMGFDCIYLGSPANLTGITKLCEKLPPDGEPGWSHGNWSGIRTDDFNFFEHNIATAFGDDYYNTWIEMIRRDLIRWGCNTVACWSDRRFIERGRLPYVVIGPGYPQTKTCIFRDFPDVYSPEFAENAEKWAHFLDYRRDDPYLLGYFMSNEPQWAFVNNINLAAFALAHESKLVTKDRIIDGLCVKYGDIDALNTAWGTSFASFEDLYTPFEPSGETAMADLMESTEEMIRTYIRIPAEAARRADPNHLNLGIRYAWLSSKALAAGCEYTDVFSFNCYSMDPTGSIDLFSEMTGKPVIIGEFHFGALDRGMDATGLRGVTTQHERGVAYRYYMERAASNPMCLGAHYFTLYDQSYLGRFDGENYQIGVLDVCSRPYTEFLEGIVDTHRTLYDVADGRIEPTTQMANEIEAIAF